MPEVSRILEDSGGKDSNPNNFSLLKSNPNPAMFAVHANPSAKDLNQDSRPHYEYVILFVKV